MNVRIGVEMAEGRTFANLSSGVPSSKQRCLETTLTEEESDLPEPIFPSETESDAESYQV